MSKHVKQNVIATPTIRVDNAEALRALGVGRVMIGEKYAAFNPYVGAKGASWHVCQLMKGGSWVRCVDKTTGRDFLYTAEEARDLVG
jgi:hypothetical protein